MRAEDRQWLLDALRVSTVSPLEGGDLHAVQTVQDLLIAGALARGFIKAELHEPGDDVFTDPLLPEPLRAFIEDKGGASFLATQPTAILRIGTWHDPATTLVLNFHIDTVGPHLDVVAVGDEIAARGAIDDKGPGIAALIGVADAFRMNPSLSDIVGVIVLAVPGEESGAFGFFGTRDVLRRQDVRGAAMLFLEPTEQRVIDAASGTMTPEIVVEGWDSTDDRPNQGTNATLLLSHAAVVLAETLGPIAEEIGARFCIAGIHTGHTHNRVYGSGSLRMNIAYFTLEQRTRMEQEVEHAFAGLKMRFADALGGLGIAERAAQDHDRIVLLRWQKRGIPVLQNRNAELEDILRASGFQRAEDTAIDTAFTCDAVWAAGHAEYVAVLGPGSLDGNGAHTPHERISIAELDQFASGMRNLVETFARARTDWEEAK